VIPVKQRPVGFYPGKFAEFALESAEFAHIRGPVIPRPANASSYANILNEIPWAAERGADRHTLCMFNCCH
jgi:hypothetical protein